MNDGGSIGEFFYNIIPGTIFLFLIKYLFHINIINLLDLNTSDSAITIFIYIIIGLTLGFLFQCFTKILRRFMWNERAFNKVRNKRENREVFHEVCINLFGKKYQEDTCLDVNCAFYFMDNCLRGVQKAFLPTHFSSRFAFWSNISWSIFFIILINLYFHDNVNLNYIFVLLFIFSLIMADWHLENFYDSIFKSYYMNKVKK